MSGLEVCFFVCPQLRNSPLSDQEFLDCGELPRLPLATLHESVPQNDALIHRLVEDLQKDCPLGFAFCWSQYLWLNDHRVMQMISTRDPNSQNDLVKKLPKRTTLARTVTDCGSLRLPTEPNLQASMADLMASKSVIVVAPSFSQRTEQMCIAA